MRPQQFANREDFIEDLSSYVSTGISGFDRDWVRRQLNVRFGDRVMIETDGQELGDWSDITPPRPEPGEPIEQDDEVVNA